MKLVTRQSFTLNDVKVIHVHRLVTSPFGRLIIGFDTSDFVDLAASNNSDEAPEIAGFMQPLDLGHCSQWLLAICCSCQAAGYPGLTLGNYNSMGALL